MYDLITIIKKEFIELKHSSKNLWWLLIWLGFPIWFLYGNMERSVIPISLMIVLLPTFIGLGLCSQLVMDSILNEKKTKTLEMLLSTKIPPITILFGKIIPPVLLGYILSLLYMVFLSFMPAEFKLEINKLILFGLPLIISYITACISTITSIIIQDEKIMPSVGILMVVLPLVGIANASLNQTGWIVVIVAILLISSLLPWLASLILAKYPMITKI